MPELGLMIEKVGDGIGVDELAQLAREGVLSRFYVNYPAQTMVGIQAFAQSVQPARVYPWVNGDPGGDLNQTQRIVEQLRDFGFRRVLLDLEKESEAQRLDGLLAAARSMGEAPYIPFGAFYRAELAEMAYADTEGCEVGWQAYFDSREGDRPGPCVRSLYQPDLLVASGANGRAYRVGFKTQLGGVSYRWCHGVGMNQDRDGYFSLDDQGRRVLVKAYVVNSTSEMSDALGLHDMPPVKLAATFRRESMRARRAAAEDLARFGTSFVVLVDRSDFRRVYRPGSLSASIGTFLGFAPYARVRIVLDVSSPAAVAAGHSDAEWASIAREARFPGAAQRGIDLFRENNLRVSTIRAIKAGIG